MTTPEEHIKEISEMEETEKKTHPEFFNDTEKKNQRRSRWWIWFLIFIAVIFVTFTLYYLLVVDKSLNKIIGRHPNPISEVENVISPDLLRGETAGDINVLFLGMRGQGQEYPFATNAVMLINYDVSKKAINTISFTRDLLVPVQGENRKINSICEKADANPLNCIGLAKEVLESITGTTIHYVFIADFQGFVSLINNSARVTVDLKGKAKDYPFLKEKEFDSARDQNPEIFHLNGEQSLTFVRWPKDAFPDYGRIERQQIFLKAAENQLMNPNLLLNPVKLKSLLETASDHARTDFQIWELVKFANYTANASISKFSLSTNQNSQGGILTDSGRGDHSYVPIDGINDFGSIKKFINTIISEN